MRVLTGVALATFSVIVIACGGGGSQPQGTRPAKADDVKWQAIAYAEEYVRPSLKTPSVAEFPSETVVVSRMDPYIVAGKECRRWMVVGGVDSQNSFGAMIRSKWGVIIIEKDGKMAPAVVMLEKRTIFKAPDYDEDQKQVTPSPPPTSKKSLPTAKATKPEKPEPDLTLRPDPDKPIVLAVSSDSLEAHSAAARKKNQAAIDSMMSRSLVHLVTAELPVKVESRGERISYVVPTEGPLAGKSLAIFSADLPK